MEELGDVLAKQEKLLGFDHAEVTKTRDLLNEILSERATPKFSWIKTRRSIQFQGVLQPTRHNFLKVSWTRTERLIAIHPPELWILIPQQIMKKFSLPHLSR